MSPTVLEALVILFLVVINGLFSMSEMALVSARKARLQAMAERGNPGAAAALKLSADPSTFLATTQVGITLVGILTGAFSGQSISRAISAWLRTVPSVAKYADTIALIVVVLAVTYLSLVVGELVPKRLAQVNAERIAAGAAGPMSVLSKVALPAVKLFSFSTELLLRLFRLHQTSEPAVTEEEVKLLMEQGADAGIFERAEHEIVERLFRFSDRRASSLMTPRPDIIWLDVNDSREAVVEKLRESGRSAFPVCDSSLDTTLGFVKSNQILRAILSGEELDLRSLAQSPLFIPESVPAQRLLTQFRESGTHLALVLDEHGGTQGLVTPTDILEALVGDLPGVGEGDEAEAVQREDGSWLLDGAMLFQDVERLFPRHRFPEDLDAGYETLGGFVMERLSRIPVAGDQVTHAGLIFEVLDMDGRRVDKVLVQEKD